MAYRYRMHWYSDEHAPSGAGRALAGRTAESAVSEAATLWADRSYASAAGYVVIDTEDGSTLCRHERV